MKRTLFALALFAAACSPAPSSDSADGIRQSAVGAAAARFAADTSVVFQGDKARELTEPCSRAAPGPVEATWTPSARDIAAMEPALAALLAERLAAEWPDEQIAALEYRRQYGGLVIGGRRVITVNGFRAEAQDDLDAWRSFPQIICDGGAIMFGVEYDPATRAFENFAFNGAI